MTSYIYLTLVYVFASRVTQTVRQANRKRTRPEGDTSRNFVAQEGGEKSPLSNLRQNRRSNRAGELIQCCGRVWTGKYYHKFSLSFFFCRSYWLFFASTFEMFQRNLKKKKQRRENQKGDVNFLICCFVFVFNSSPLFGVALDKEKKATGNREHHCQTSQHNGEGF